MSIFPGRYNLNSKHSFMETERPNNRTAPVTNRSMALPLPKAQPTRSSSSQRFSLHNKIDLLEMQTCPEVSQFSTGDTSFYFHRLNIDYGHLEQPQGWKGRSRHAASHALLPNRCIPPEKHTNIPLLDSELVRKEECGLSKPSRSSITRLKEQKGQSQKKHNPEASRASKIVTHTALKSIVAAKCNNDHQTPVQGLGPSTDRNQSWGTGSKKKLRPAQHCRIVRTYVGGSKMQIKIINYPDNSEYLRLCQPKN